MHARETLQHTRRTSGAWSHLSARAAEKVRAGAQDWLKTRGGRRRRGSDLPSRRAGRPSFFNTTVAVGAALAVTALLVRRAARRQEQRHPPTGRFLEVNGVRLHYLESGTGQPVVLLHGNGVQARDFVGSGLFDALARRYRVVAFDRPGFGYSERPRSRLWSPQAQATLLQGAFAQLGLERPVVVGHSWGAMVALALALQHPESVRGLLLVSGYFFPTMRWDSLLLSGPAIPLLGDLMRYTVSPLLGRLLTPLQIRQLFAPEPVPAAFREAVPLGMMLRPWQLRASAAEAALMMPAARALASRFGELHLPVTVAAGGEDQIADPQAHAVRLHEALPDSQLVLLPGRGHMLHYAEAERLAAAVHALFAHEKPRRRALESPPAPRNNSCLM